MKFPFMMKKIKSSKGEAWLAGKIKHRLHDLNLNWMATFIGPPGSGKSWTALRVAELIDDTFTWDQGAFDVDAVLERVWEWKLKRGSAVILDEAGLAIDSRKWFEHANQALSYMVESFRYLGLAFLITVPDPSFIDRIPRSLFNMGFECLRVNQDEHTVTVRPYLNQLNPRLGKVYQKRPHIWRPEEGRTKVRSMKINRPSKELTDTYEEARHRYMQAFHGELLRKGREMQIDSLGVKEQVNLILKEIEQMDDDRLKNTRGNWDTDLIRVEFNTSHGIARAVSKILMRGSGE